MVVKGGGGVTFYNTTMANLIGWITTNNNTYDSCDLKLRLVPFSTIFLFPLC